MTTFPHPDARVVHLLGRPEPTSRRDVARRLARGDLAPGDLFWLPGLPGWVALADRPDLVAGIAPTLAGDVVAMVEAGWRLFHVDRHEAAFDRPDPPGRALVYDTGRVAYFEAGDGERSPVTFLVDPPPGAIVDEVGPGVVGATMDGAVPEAVETLRQYVKGRFANRLERPLQRDASSAGLVGEIAAALARRGRVDGFAPHPDGWSMTVDVGGRAHLVVDRTAEPRAPVTVAAEASLDLSPEALGRRVAAPPTVAGGVRRHVEYDRAFASTTLLFDVAIADREALGELLAATLARLRAQITGTSR